MKYSLKNVAISFSVIFVLSLIILNYVVTKEINEASQLSLAERTKPDPQLAINSTKPQSRTGSLLKYPSGESEPEQPTKASSVHASKANLVDAKTLDRKLIIYEIPLDEDVLTH